MKVVRVEQMGEKIGPDAKAAAGKELLLTLQGRTQKGSSCGTL